MVRLYRLLVLAQLRGQLQSPVSFGLDVLSTSLITITEFGAFVLVFGRFGSLAGWSLAQMLLLYGMVEFSFSLMDMIFAGFDPPVFAQYIRKGTLDQFLLRPGSLMLHILGSDLTLRRVGRLLLGLGILVYALFANPIFWTLEKALLLPMIVSSLVLYFGALFLCGATLMFWTIESTEAMNVLTYGGAYLMSYPMDIYSNWLRITFTFILPAALMNYYPALYILGKPDPFGLPAFMPFIAPLAAGTMFWAALEFWKFGLKHYQSTGN